MCFLQSFWSLLAAPITAFVSSTVDFADFLSFRLVVFYKKVVCEFLSDYHSETLEINCD